MFGPKIFISYRRADSAVHAARIFEGLVAAFGPRCVFIDTRQIELGANFPQTIDEWLESCDFLIAVIGSHWLVSQDGVRRLNASNDFVRHEIAAALARRIPVIPVFVDGGTMPGADDLPADLAELPTQNGQLIRNSTDEFAFDLAKLISRLDGRLDLVDSQQLERLRRSARLLWVAIAVAMMVLAWVQAFDLFHLDTIATRTTMAIGSALAPGTASPDIVLVTIDDRTGKPEFNGSWRLKHAKLIDVLSNDGARTVAFDMFFQDPSPFDGALLAAVERAAARKTHVIVGEDLSNTIIPGLRDRAFGTALLCVGDALHFGPEAPLAIRHVGTPSPAGNPTEPLASLRLSLGMLATLSSSDVSLESGTVLADAPKLVASGGYRGTPDVVSLSTMETVREARDECGGLAENDQVASVMLRLSRRGTWTRFSYGDVLAKRIPAEAFRGKVVLVGLAREHVDEHPVRYGFTREQRFGVELHADVANNLIRETRVSDAHWIVKLSLTVGFALLGAAIRFSPNPRVSGHGRMIVLAIALAYVGLTVLSYAEFGVLIDYVYPVFTLLITFWAVGFATQLKRARVRAEAVALAGRDSDAPKAEGERRPSSRPALLCIVALLMQLPIAGCVRPPAKLTRAFRGDERVGIGTLRPEEFAVTRPEVGVLRPIPTALQRGDTVETGSNASAVLVFADGTRVFVGPDTRVVISSIILQQIAGKLSEILVNAKSRFHVQTPLTTAGVKGTKYRLRLSDSGVSLDGAEGTVLLSPTTGKWSPLEVHEGETASIEAKQPPRLRRLSDEERQTLRRAFDRFDTLFDISILPSMQFGR